jgi:hypothetical protein
MDQYRLPDLPDLPALPSQISVAAPRTVGVFKGQIIKVTGKRRGLAIIISTED